MAEHSVIVMMHVAHLGGDDELQLAALLHDAHEALLGDWTRPARNALRQLGAGDALDELERIHIQAIADWAGLDFAQLTHPLVQRADDEVCLAEMRDLFVGPLVAGLPTPPELSTSFALLEPRHAELLFAKLVGDRTGMPSGPHFALMSRGYDLDVPTLFDREVTR